MCANLTEFEAESNAVQRVVNDFGRNKELISRFCSLGASLFLGTVASKFGFKTIIVLSLISTY